MIAASARMGNVSIHFPEAYSGKIFIAQWSATKGGPAARTDRDTRHTWHIPLLCLHAKSSTTQQLGENPPRLLCSSPDISASWHTSLSICPAEQFVRQQDANHKLLSTKINPAFKRKWKFTEAEVFRGSRCGAGVRTRAWQGEGENVTQCSETGCCETTAPAWTLLGWFNTILILNPKHSTAPATRDKIISIPAMPRTTVQRLSLIKSDLSSHAM